MMISTWPVISSSSIAPLPTNPAIESLSSIQWGILNVLEHGMTVEGWFAARPSVAGTDPRHASLDQKVYGLSIPFGVAI
ncbi:hypothetical protein NMY22_g3797 [Coprinellus aureogranulatus]|nr:hypothetical protein NMY22_g3797 [Coprinellus aureogranulatus]